MARRRGLRARQIANDALELADVARAVGEPDPLFELVGVQAARQRVIAQEGHDPFALGVRGADLEQRATATA